MSWSGLLGPPLGAFLFAAGRAWPFLTQAILVTLALLLVTQIVSAPGSSAERVAGSVRSEVKEGFQWSIGHPPVRTLALIILSFNITWGAAWSAPALNALHRVHLGEVGYGLMTTSGAIGGTLAIITYERLEARWSSRHDHASVLDARGPNALVAGAEYQWRGCHRDLFVFASTAFGWSTVSQTVCERAVPHSSKVGSLSVSLIACSAGFVIGQILGGVLASESGIVAPFWFAFIGSGVTLALVWRQLADIAHAGA